MQGPLQKQGGGQFSKQWRGRYFALERGHELRWWQNERLFLEGARARGEVDLRGARVELLSTDGGSTGPGHRKNTSLQSPLASFQAPPKQRVSRKLSARWSSVSTVPPNVLQLIPAQGAYSRDLLLQASTKAELQNHPKCSAGWCSDFEGYWMGEVSSGCGDAGYNSWSGAAGAYCCNA